MSCREVTRLMAESFERRLTLKERLSLRMHTMMCGTCRLFLRLQHQINRAVRHGAEKWREAASEQVLPDESRQRLQTAVQAGLTDINDRDRS